MGTVEPDRWRSFGIALIGTLLVAGVCLWISNLTDGPEYGGPWDVPAINYITWFGFVIASIAAAMVAVGMVLRGLAAGWDRVREGRSKV